MRVRIDITGQRFGRLIALCISTELLSDRPAWFCRCDCGKELTVRGNFLRSGKSTSCGCYIKERLHAGLGATHGMSRSTTHKSWDSMIGRCKRQNDPSYQRYGAQGIAVCERWLKFENFLSDIGQRPKGKTLDRFPNNKGNYEPGNCRWATPKEQSNNTKWNRTLMYRGKLMTARELSDLEGVSFGMLRARIFRRGQDVESALQALKTGE